MRSPGLVKQSKAIFKEEWLKFWNTHSIKIPDKSLLLTIYIGRQTSNWSFNSARLNHCSMVKYENILNSKVSIMLYLQINLVADFALMHEAHHDNEDEPCIINASTPLIGPLLSFSTYL